MLEKIKLKKVFGDIFFTGIRVETARGAYIYAQWFGVQSVETVKEGCNKMLDIMKETPCTKLLNSNKEVIGSWDMAIDWVQHEWAPKMRAAGMQYIAQVIPTSIYATLTIESLIQKIDNDFEIRTFDEIEDAEAWLASF